MSPWPFTPSQPRDYSLPNASWSSEMQRLYEHYNNLCEMETEGGEKIKGAWRRLPSYNRSLKYATGGQCLSKLLQGKARIFTRNIEEQGAGFEYVVFVNKQEKTCVCVFQAGHLLEGPPGHVHGGAIATIIDSVTGTHATYLSGPVMTANLTVNYRSPIPLGSVVLVHSSLDKTEGRKTFLSCQVTSTDGSKMHTEATGIACLCPLVWATSWDSDGQSSRCGDGSSYCSERTAEAKQSPWAVGVLFECILFLNDQFSKTFTSH
ncbi:hypothetical protein JZ751_009915 [Albula glossodonta]|uniref:Acyl-coenzyme A thioesterase THEM4 n=1 Tax=Albula glossodonta TaxID=121402 RepID=A0A8T2P752_9TELE|nr:hypothetical protein JZ751_009915 [Albula glossodonta]